MANWEGYEELRQTIINEVPTLAMPILMPMK